MLDVSNGNRDENRFGEEAAYAEIFAAVRAQILALEPIGIGELMTEASRLIEDVGLDSLKFVDLTVRLEDTLGIAEFPMQEWIDRQIEAGRPLSVGELTSECVSLATSAARS